ATASAAFSGSTTFQNSTASTSTGTVSLVSVFSALNDEVITRMSIQYAIVSRIGMMPKRPGPLSARNLPSLKTTARSQADATRIAAATTAATTTATTQAAMSAIGATP